jgi:hypothetical protein
MPAQVPFAALLWPVSCETRATVTHSADPRRLRDGADRPEDERWWIVAEALSE